MHENQIIRRHRPVIRVFVSSTFSDLKLERDALQQRVFPNLEQLCLKEGFQFQAIDLRWGISTEAGLDHRTMGICLDELRRSQEISPEPNFLILLGNRYGWRPLPEAISQAEFDALVAVTQPGADGKSLPGTDGKSTEQVLREWYRRDDNVLLPDPLPDDPDRMSLNYILQSRQRILDGRMKYGRQKSASGEGYEDTPEWLAVQAVLWNTINAAFPADARFKNRFQDIDWNQHIQDVHSTLAPKRAVPQIVRFQGSATEQEIWCGALSVPHADQHVLAFFREIIPSDITEERKRVCDFFDVASGQIDPPPQAAQHQLKQVLKDRLGENAVDLKPTARLEIKTDDFGKSVPTVSADHIDTLCREVESRLQTIIERQIQQYWQESSSSDQKFDESKGDWRTARELEIEKEEHLRFGQERGPKDTFVGRTGLLERIRDYTENDSPWPLVIYGASGCGKTVLLARAFQDVPARKKPIIRFLGVSPRSSDHHSLMKSLCLELREKNPLAEALPTDIRELVYEYQQHLHNATDEQPVILFLDALDQLADADHGRLLNWLPPGSLPAHVKLVVSCSSDRATADRQRQQQEPRSITDRLTTLIGPHKGANHAC